MKKDNLEPLYQQIKEDIKLAIENGKYKTSEKIPGETELSIEYSASRITVRRAIEELSNDGYLIKKQGIGTFVSSPRIHRKLLAGTSLENFTTTCKNNNLEAGARLIKKQIVPIRSDESEFLNVDEDSLLIYIERLRTADGLPIFIENLFLPYNEFKSIINEDLNDSSLFELISKVSGRKPVDSTKRTLEVTRASKYQAKILGVLVGEPLLYLNIHMIDENNDPICIGRQYYIGSRYMFEV